ncbi:ATP-binding protein [Parapedobacter soli]|uniref:ATP-binding protein n=1 Tax=Parapedobacter soli TaxID=416955 RepID=UPI0021C8CA3E|nr:ATP-binding protein [Parapedobacter soli]
MSHEFRTPLTLIISPLEEIVSTKINNEWLESRLKVMLFNAKRLLHLIDQILEIRELESGHHIIQHKPLFISSLMREIVDSFKALADKQHISLRYTERKIDEIPLLVDQDKVEKIFFNLLSNAFKFTPEGGEIAINVSCRDHVYYFEVKDTGQGIDEVAVERIFDRFFKKGKSNYGAGIGLSVSKLLVEVMGGTIEVESKRNVGTRFFITLPLQPAPYSGLDVNLPPVVHKPIPLEYQDVVLGVRQENDGHLTKETILVVEDNEDLKTYLVDQLSLEYDVVTAVNGEKALKKAKRLGPALIVSDVMMPKMDGFELCSQLKSTDELCHIPIILLTAKSSHVYKLQGLEQGADDYISKPFNILELKARIKNILQNRKLLHEKYRSTTHLSIAKEVAINSYDEQLLTKLHHIMTENLDKPNLTVEYLGDQVGLSRVHLFRKLKALIGLTPSEFIRDFRIKHAQEMLGTGKFRVVDVASLVGFQDVQYFSKVFKKETGKSPSDYSKLSET